MRPFKPQNMSNNAAVARIPETGEWGEIGRGQWLQALAAGAPPSVDMNPVLLKPQSETGSQVVLRGKVVGEAKGRDYQRLKAGFLETVLESFDRLCGEADLVIVEGAGSPAEINLRAGDIANMGFATAADVPVILVGDIDRGGVIASLVGTHAILPDADRAAIAGFLINKFRGDVSLFDDGLAAITRYTGWPSLGVVPHLSAAAKLPAEDSVALERLVRGPAGRLTVAVPMIGRIANFDDLDPLSRAGRRRRVRPPGRAASGRRRGSSSCPDRNRPSPISVRSGRTAGTPICEPMSRAAAMSSACAAATRCSAASSAIPWGSRARCARRRGSASSTSRR